MKKPRVIVLVFSGEEPDEGVLTTIAANIGAMCNTEVVEPFVLGPKDIAATVLGSVHFGEIFPPKEEKPHECKTPEDNAAVFVGNLMRKELGDDFTRQFFVASLIDRIRKARKHPSNQLNREFLNALFILSQPDLNLSKTILEETHLDPDRIAIIRDTFNFMQKYE